MTLSHRFDAWTSCSPAVGSIRLALTCFTSSSAVAAFEALVAVQFASTSGFAPRAVALARAYREQLVLSCVLCPGKRRACATGMITGLPWLDCAWRPVSNLLCRESTGILFFEVGLDLPLRSTLFYNRIGQPLNSLTWPLCECSMHLKTGSAWQEGCHGACGRAGSQTSPNEVKVVLVLVRPVLIRSERPGSVEKSVAVASTIICAAALRLAPSQQREAIASHCKAWSSVGI